MTLEEYVRLNSTIPFEVGKQDCVLFVCRWIKNQTGKDLLENIKPWNTKFQALRRLVEVGGLELACMEKLGQPAKQFKDGDIVLMKPPFTCMGITMGPRVVVVTYEGISLMETSDIKFVWNLQDV